MKLLIESLYWRLCQYPWYTIVNIGFALAIYLLARKYGSAIRMFCCNKVLGVTYITDPVSMFFLDCGLTFTFVSILIIIVCIPLLLYKGIIFNILGYSFYFWLLFFPVQLICILLKKQVRPLFYNR